MYEHASSVIDVINFIVLLAISVAVFQIFVKTRADEELVASILFLKKQHLYDVALLGVLGIVSMSAGSFINVANTFGIVEYNPILNNIFKFNGLSLIFFGVIMVHKMMKR